MEATIDAILSKLPPLSEHAKQSSLRKAAIENLRLMERKFQNGTLKKGEAARSAIALDLSYRQLQLPVPPQLSSLTGVKPTLYQETRTRVENVLGLRTILSGVKMEDLGIAHGGLATIVPRADSLLKDYAKELGAHADVSDPVFTLAAYWVAAKSETGKTAGEINYLKDQLLASHSGVDGHHFREVAESLKRSAHERAIGVTGRGSKAREGPAAKRIRLGAAAAAAANSGDHGRKALHLSSASSSSSSSSFAADDLLHRSRARVACEEEEEQNTSGASMPQPPPRKAEPVKFVYMPLSPKPEGWEEYLKWKTSQLLSSSGRAPLPLSDYTKFLS